MGLKTIGNLNCERRVFEQERGNFGGNWCLKSVPGSCTLFSEHHHSMTRWIMNDQQLQQLTFDLQNGSDRQRRAASYKLGNSKNPAAVNALINAYRDPDASVKQNVVNGLANIGTPDALEFLNSIGRADLTPSSPTYGTAVDLAKREHLGGKDKNTILNALKKEGLTPANAQKAYDSALKELEGSAEGRSMLAEKYRKQMNRGLLWAVAGTVITIVSYSSAASSPVGGTYYICWGAILFGVIDFIVGYISWRKYQ